MYLGLFGFLARFQWFSRSRLHLPQGSVQLLTPLREDPLHLLQRRYCLRRHGQRGGHGLSRRGVAAPARHGRRQSLAGVRRPGGGHRCPGRCCRRPRRCRGGGRRRGCGRRHGRHGRNRRHCGRCHGGCRGRGCFDRGALRHVTWRR